MRQVAEAKDSSTAVSAEMRLGDAKVRQAAIVEYLRGRGESYDSLAALFGIKSGGTLRAYVTRKPSMVKTNNQNIKLIHAALVEPSERLEAILPAEMREDYLSSTGASDRPIVTYRRRDDNEQTTSPENMLALVQIANDVFRVGDTIGSTRHLRRICGRYYAYRASAEANVIVKSYLEITEQKLPGSGGGDRAAFFQFTHWHPDRIFDPRHDQPRQTRGIVLYLNTNIFLIGSTEGGQAACFFAVREPIRKEFRLLSGYTLTTNMDHVLFSARTIFARDGDADKSKIGRISVAETDEQAFRDAERFDLKLLRNTRAPYLNELISSVRL